MIRRRLLATAVGAGLLLAALPAFAEVDAGGSESESAEAEALRLLERASVAGRRLTYSGTQYVASWHGDNASTAVVELQHDPESGVVLSGEEAVPATATLDPRLLPPLAASYALSVAGDGRCAGRSAAVVEARRDEGQVAGRFWIDRATGVLLRREVFDADGGRVHSSAFVDLDVRRESRAAPMTAVSAVRLDRAELERFRGDGWHVPERLPDGFRLFETRQDGQVLHLAYTDGLSTLSLFAQRGELGTAPMKGFTADDVGGRPVWVRQASPERVVWSGGDKVWTLVSDAPHASVRSAVAALPRDPAPDDGVRTRLARGLARLGGMLNPFD